MRRLAESFTSILSSTRVAVGGRLHEPLDPTVELAPFEKRLEEIRQVRDLGGGRLPPRADIDALVDRWAQVRPSLEPFTRRELRALAWDGRTAADATFVEALVAADLVPSKVAFLRGLWHAHQQEWRLASSPRIERLIGRAADEAAGYRPRWLARIAATPSTLGQEAPLALATSIAPAWDRARTVLDDFAVTPTGKLGQLAVDRAITRWVDQMAATRSSDEATPLMAAGRAGLLDKAMAPAALFQGAVARLLGEVARGRVHLKPVVARLILEDERLGHPRRYATRGNWVVFSEEAQRIAIQLFAARDLRMFFDHLIGTGDDYQHRRQFWERYVESPQLADFAIACDWGDRQLLNSRWKEGRGQIADLDDAPMNHSAFVMRFVGREDITIAEMSQANKAMYLFRTSDFEAHVGSLFQQRFRFRALRDRSIAGWHPHTPPHGGWHRKFEQILAQYGVRPR